MFTSGIAILLVLGGLIFFHEFGHFIVARGFGMGVHAFSLGFGPKLLGFTRGNTLYKVAAIPLGGYVQLAGETGEEEEDSPFPPEALFSNRPAWQRMCVVAAGPIFNLLLAFLIYWFLALAQGVGYYLPVAGTVVPDSPAMAAGFEQGDRILNIDGTPIDSWTTMVKVIRQSEGKKLHVTVQRDDTKRNLEVTPEVKTYKNIFGEDTQVVAVGIQLDGSLAFRPVEGLGLREALTITWFKTVLIVDGFIKIVERLIPLDTIGGPIALAQVIHKGAQSGLFDLLGWTAIISINLAILNLLPIPVLDGGHILYFFLEIILRRPIDEKWRAVATRVGIVFLLALMSLAIFNDIRRLFS
ncbi:RIP metalloprotease RseP [Pseudodesulfovibrio tunisiensis]|uniref:RIP metalloprotease RseP n=1 Tax=Pseudodesulfovibrio tunisiensis TaxID=463192 RepID=UPI001FB4901C|nr:RIP metalloprotease RseP [Pseudodesulfovibrio tunisiensis]